MAASRDSLARDASVRQPERACKHGCGRAAEKKRTTCGPCRWRMDAPAKPRGLVGRKKRSGGHAHHISVEQWVAIYTAQAGLCAICGKPLRNRYDAESQGQTAAVDHCHVAEKTVGPVRSIRGLLCAYPCNRLLVRYWTPDRLERAARYSRLFPAQVILATHK